ncbi:hypothetical protein ST47_g7512 [Ascochyta rabiei]|uniref:Uncharacterized protein n=2 Tax=Didymella rabiei TaxID=5454 RepID=A0A163ASK8_DIDRA|nr:hypothetical protein ST47_g7512 [Ascochyta rabiei]
MAHHNRSRTPRDARSIHPLYRMRSEGQLTATKEQSLPRLRSMGQLSSPPDWPLPPIPSRSPLRPSGRNHGGIGPPFLGSRTVNMNSRFSVSRSSSSSDSTYSQDDETDTGRRFGRNTMLVQEQTDQKKIEFTLRRDSKQTPTLKDLSSILHLRGRLQEMGTTFTAEGEMLTYGNPPLNADLEQMLRLGVMYDEQWNMFFTGHEVKQDSKSNLWSDLKVLQKMLQNEGIFFGEQQKRLNYGNSHPKLIRLSDQYDVLREEWANKTMQSLHPLQRRSPTHDELPQTPTNIGWKFLFDDSDEEELARKKRRRSSRLTVVVEEPQLGNGPGPTVEERRWLGDELCSSPTGIESSHAPHDIGDKPLPPAPDTRSNTRSRGFTVGTPTLLHGSSPLQATETPSMLLRNVDLETQTTYTIGEEDSPTLGRVNRWPEQISAMAFLVEDERRRAEERQRIEMWDVGEGTTKDKKKSKGVRKWLRTVLGRKKGGEQ